MFDTFQRLSRWGDQPLCLAVLDVDNFKQINSVQGHAGGDATLRGIARALTGHSGAKTSSRAGVATSSWSACTAWRLRTGVSAWMSSSSRFDPGPVASHEHADRITISASLAEFPRHGRISTHCTEQQTQLCTPLRRQGATAYTSPAA